MITLFIDTSLSDVSIAILNQDKVLASITKNIPNEHSVYTVSFIDDLLKESRLKPKDIEQIMVVNGPGSFTGIRIGVTIAKVYAYLVNIPVIVVSSLKMMAISVKHSNCLSLIDAHHGHYYMGLYDSNNQEIIPEKFVDQEEVLEILKQYQPFVVCREQIKLGQHQYEPSLLDVSKVVSYYSTSLGKNPHFVVPNYLKLPQALEQKHD